MDEEIILHLPGAYLFLLVEIIPGVAVNPPGYSGGRGAV
jgi:hypothetical protein